jgi:hypothetical protein
MDDANLFKKLQGVEAGSASQLAQPLGGPLANLTGSA